jgi:formate/nitrite transporter
VAGAELFTGNTLIVVARLTGAVTTRALLRNWAIAFAGNFVGAVATAALVALSGQWTLADGQVGATAIAIAQAKLSLGAVEAVTRGVLGNALVCLAVWLCFSARSVTDEILAIVPPITAFVAAGFEHSVANMYFVPLALLLPGEHGLTWGRFLLDNLVPVTAGNLIGGAVMVGAIYWLVYLRSERRALR